MSETSWRPDRKIMSAAIAAVSLWIVQIFIPDLDIPVGIEGALVTIVGYLIPNPAP